MSNVIGMAGILEGQFDCEYGATLRPIGRTNLSMVGLDNESAEVQT
jgi:hypothetical protein